MILKLQHNHFFFYTLASAVPERIISVILRGSDRTCALYCPTLYSSHYDSTYTP
jgi:hypothetical protein